jgi:hypothetical protein
MYRISPVSVKLSGKSFDSTSSSPMDGYNVRKNCLLAPASSMISTRPGLSCSMAGTWLARIPISPDSAGMFTWTLFLGISSAIRSQGSIILARVAFLGSQTYTSWDL